MKICDLFDICSNTEDIELAIIALNDSEFGEVEEEYFRGGLDELSDDLWGTELDSWEIAGGNGLSGYVVAVRVQWEGGEEE